jgi:hypothetical protein
VHVGHDECVLSFNQSGSAWEYLDAIAYTMSLRIHNFE